jgi:hypothetical protein
VGEGEDVKVDVGGILVVVTTTGWVDVDLLCVSIIEVGGGKVGWGEFDQKPQLELSKMRKQNKIEQILSRLYRWCCFVYIISGWEYWSVAQERAEYHRDAGLIRV